MRIARRFRAVIVAALVYLLLCAIGGIFLADGALHPARRLLNKEESDAMRQSARDLAVYFAEVSIASLDGTILRAWILQPQKGSGDAVILLHGLADNRAGMSGYAQLLLLHGYTVLLPDSRGHGASDGTIATYGLLERQDIREWFRYLVIHQNPVCIFGFGESMGAAQLLQSLSAGIPFCAVAAESPFSDFREIAYDRMGQQFHLGPWVGRILLRPMVEAAFLRARSKYGLNMQEISPERSAAAANVPILLIHGEMDSNIPVRHSRRIHQLAPQTQLWEVSGADHCGAVTVAPQEFERRLVQWFSTHGPR